MPVITTPPARVDAFAARRDLRDQIARLEHELAATLAEVFPRREPLRSARPASAPAGPRVLTLGQLECVRDELADRLQTLRAPRGDVLLEQMCRAPERHRWMTVTSAELGEPGCQVWRVRPRFGLLGMLMGWWRVKVSSGCPLPGLGACPRTGPCVGADRGSSQAPHESEGIATVLPRVWVAVWRSVHGRFRGAGLLGQALRA